MRLSSTVFLLVITISLFSASTIPFVDIIQEVDALKSKGTYTRQYGSATGICGLQLCSEISKPAPSQISEKAQKEMQSEKTETIIPDNLSDIKDDQMEASVKLHDIISGKSIHADFPTIQTLSVTHANQIDPVTYILEYEITGGDKNLDVVLISVYSDIETIHTEIPGLPSHSESVQRVIINANDPSSITAHIQSYN